MNFNTYFKNIGCRFIYKKIKLKKRKITFAFNFSILERGFSLMPMLSLKFVLLVIIKPRIANKFLHRYGGACYSNRRNFR